MSGTDAEPTSQVSRTAKLSSNRGSGSVPGNLRRCTDNVSYSITQRLGDK